MLLRDSRDSLPVVDPHPHPHPRPGLIALLRQALGGGELDYTELPLRRAVFLLAVPMVMEMAMESLFAVADIFWVSRLGADAVATVGLTEALIATVYAVAMGVSVAATATVSRRVGEKGSGAGLARGRPSHDADVRAGADHRRRGCAARRTLAVDDGCD